ncbi:MAG TPA: DEAD/DEAH box helicase family protein [Prolixibacteraceae bacterium]|nr:DEAD/DEAH box helicase family protein [Prolixibacteraceae bacterium]
MELKGYQQKVLRDLEQFLGYVQQWKKSDKAFNRFWEERIGPYNPLSGEGMQPYKNTLPNTVHVCVKVPTAGGKTFIACNALHTIFSFFSGDQPKVVVWLVPWSNLLDQTVNHLSNPGHPYRQKLDSLFHHRVEVYEKKDLLQGSNFNPSVVREQLTILVMSFSSLRARNKEDRKVYQENGQLASFVTQYRDKSHLLDDTDDTALINVIRSMMPVVVVDESHNAESELSVEMLKALNRSFVLDLTATPRDNSNIISLIPAIELKKEHMVKLPVIVYNHHDKTEVVNSALHLQQKLEGQATAEYKNGGKYIRPIVLFQAQPRTGEENTTFERLKEQLLRVGIPEEQIKIKTAEKDEIKGIDLSSPDCPVRYIITINALKEGWDCPFAYILASLADKSSAVDVEQILGRVLRQPYVIRHEAPLLNVSYVLTASAKFNDTLQNIVKGLQASGFSEKDYRGKDSIPDREKQPASGDLLQKFLFPELQGNEEELTNEIAPERISFSPESEAADLNNETVEEISNLAEREITNLETQIEILNRQPVDEKLFQEMGNKVKRIRMVESHKEQAQQIKLPQFFVDVTGSDLFGTHKVLLNQESLLKNFKLSTEDCNIAFEEVNSDLYKVDMEQIRKDEYAPRFTKIENTQLKEPIVEYILAKPKEGQIKEITYQLVQIIGDMYPIPEKEIRAFTGRILQQLSTEQLRDILARKWSYSDRIKAKIRFHADRNAEERFNDWITLGKITAEPAWSFPVMIVPGIMGASIGRSLYEREGAMNQFEIRVITSLASLPNIAFWHRNLGRGKGFSINGFKSNHYPDFMVATRSGKTILVETKGDDRDNSDSLAKCRLGRKWAELSGKNFLYFMIFDKNPVEGAFTLDKATELIRQL